MRYGPGCPIRSMTQPQSISPPNFLPCQPFLFHQICLGMGLVEFHNREIFQYSHYYAFKSYDRKFRVPETMERGVPCTLDSLIKDAGVLGTK